MACGLVRDVRVHATDHGVRRVGSERQGIRPGAPEVEIDRLAHDGGHGGAVATRPQSQRVVGLGGKAEVGRDVA